MSIPAIFFHPDAIEGEGKELVGRRSSGQSFLKGYLAHVGGDVVHGITQTKQGQARFEETARGLGETRPIKTHFLRGTAGFTEPDAIFFPGPGYLDAAWRRQRFGAKTCSLVGITHTVSTRRVIEGMHNLMSEPVEDWDAIICTSRAVQSVVQEQMDLEAEYFRTRFGATRVPQPQLPMIPLGIHADDFGRTDAGRAQMRDQFDAPDDATVVMTMGRFTSVEKANPVPLFLALESVAQKTGKPVHLWLVGWASRPEEEALHRDGAAALCPSVTVRIIDGRDPDVRRHVWSGADIFTLPVDNIQETFGLVPVEAMAAGLPVVMPDWDGFKDTVVNGETGFLIPTMMTGPGGGPNIAQRYADGTDDYLRYLSIVQQQTVIDMPAYAAAFEVLIENPQRRRDMGAAGRTHVQRTFDWSQVIPQYLELTQELMAIRKAGTVTTPPLSRGALSPIEVDPFQLYRSYPTANPTPDMQVSPRRAFDAEHLAQLDRYNGRNMYQRRILPDAMVLQIADAVQLHGTQTVAQIASRTGLQTGHVMAGVLLLAKFDILKIDTIFD